MTVGRCPPPRSQIYLFSHATRKTTLSHLPVPTNPRPYPSTTFSSSPVLTRPTLALAPARRAGRPGGLICAAMAMDLVSPGPAAAAAGEVNPEAVKGEEGEEEEDVVMVVGEVGGQCGGDAVVVAPADAEVEGHPYAFHVSGPRNLPPPNWREIIRSSWKDPNYKRMVMACFIQAVYLLEIDRQDQKGEEDGLAPKWWKPFKYKVTQTLVDERDGSIYGAVLEWDRSSALSDLILLRPSGAPRAVLALRGTLLQKPTIKRDLQDDLRFLVWESLKGSVRYVGALEALKAAVERFGSTNVCVAGHSLGAGFAFQVCKDLAKQGIFVDCHLFNPPSVSLAMSLRCMSEKASHLWQKVKASLPLKEEAALDTAKDEGSIKKKLRAEKKWVPHLYVNNSDYICCHYNAPSSSEPDGGPDEQQQQRKAREIAGDVVAKLFVTSSKGPQKFMEAHGLEQWWSDGMELLAVSDSKLIHRQLKSLYSSTAVPPPAKS
ncbi:GDSL esterase/lipase At4g10955-like [Triticum dicoccoides]|uniref:GDSL esterase/lipase At4g10955-like n=1 Tax=Triticum dicoccoides TaxID=85692 RepID=UPI00188F8DFC|nr:GDSL esterase/lipase At4g10955-like [Triticum dicoccoides]